MQGLAVDEVQEFISRLALVGASEAQVQTMSDASDNPADTVADTVEKFTIGITPIDAKRGTLSLSWGTFRWTAPIVVQ